MDHSEPADETRQMKVVRIARYYFPPEKMCSKGKEIERDGERATDCFHRIRDTCFRQRETETQVSIKSSLRERHPARTVP